MKFYSLSQCLGIHSPFLQHMFYTTTITLVTPRRPNQPITIEFSSGKSYCGISRFNGAGPFLALPLIS